MCTFRRMNESLKEWFESQSEHSQLEHLSELMYRRDESAKTEFETLINLVPVDSVTTLNCFE